ncbi:MAG: hypothetical protein J6Q82_07510 [Clostridia bacterium]|nr:hypothetical protein [Clostridia bacterium]
MSKTLSNILTIFKVARIVAKVVFILCIIGAAGCLLGLLALPMVGSFLSSELLIEEGLTLSSAYLGCIVGLISCIGEMILAFLAERYFKNVLNAGTPFTFDGAKECFRFGIASIIVSIAVSIASGIVAAAILVFTSSMLAEPEFGTSISLSMGLFFLFLSLIFKHGAELKKTTEETTQENSDAQ